MKQVIIYVQMCDDGVWRKLCDGVIAWETAGRDVYRILQMDVERIIDPLSWKTSDNIKLIYK
ncbi:MAG TPA: hypothetical protein DCX27_19640 [Balneola sp.]|nr:hypothetical protein [Balneola sp.]